MLSAPTTSPSPGQLVRSARNFVLEVMVAPQASSCAPAVAGTANSAIAGAMTYLKAVIHATVPSRTSITRSQSIASCSARSWLATTMVPR